MPGLFDQGPGRGPQLRGPPGGQERALGLRSHGCWAVASLARTEFLFLDCGLLHQIWCCGYLAPPQQQTWLACTPRPPPGQNPAPRQCQVTPGPLGPKQPGPRSIQLASVCPLLSMVHTGLRILRARIASLPAGTNQGGAHRVLGLHQDSAIQAAVGGPQAAHPTCDPHFPHSCAPCVQLITH